MVNLPSATAMQGVHVQVSSRRPVRAMDQHSINRASRGGRGHVSEASRFAALVCACVGMGQSVVWTFGAWRSTPETRWSTRIGKKGGNPVPGQRRLYLPRREPNHHHGLPLANFWPPRLAP